MGTVRQRSDTKEWFIDYIDATGRRVRQKIGAGKENYRLARKILAQAEAEAVMGVHRVTPAETQRFKEFAWDWFKRKEAGLRPKSRESYRGMIERYLVPAFGDRRLGALTRHDIETFLAEKQETSRLGTTTINYALGRLKSILLDAVDHGHLAASPAARVRPLRSPDGGKEHVQFLKPDEITRLLDVATPPWKGLYEVAIGTGLRRGELCGLRWRDLDLHKALLRVSRQRGRVKEAAGYVVREWAPKTRASRRTIDLSPALVQVLLAIPAGDDPERDYVLRGRTGNPIDPDGIARAFKRHLTLAGLPDVSPNALRHTHASLLIAANVNVKAIQSRMGHRSITTTLNVYGHLMPDAFTGVGERLDGLMYGTRKAQGTEAEAAVVRQTV